MKKIISAILAIAMCISMFAGITVSAATTEKEYIFAWKKHVTNGIDTSLEGVWNADTIDYSHLMNRITAWQTWLTENVGDNYQTISGYDASAIMRLTGYGTHGWKYFDMNDDSDAFMALTGSLKPANIEKDNGYVSMVTQTQHFSQPKVTSLGIELEQPSEAGWYTLSSIISRNDVELYAGIKNSSEHTVEEYMDADANFIANSVANTSTYHSYDNAILYSDGSTPIILVINTDSDKVKASYANIYKLKLTKVAEPVLSIDKTNLETGDAAKAQLKSGSAVALGDFVTYSVKEGGKDFVSVNAETGDIKALNPGTATIVATAAGVNGATYEQDVTVTLKGEKTYVFNNDGTSATSSNKEIMNDTFYEIKDWKYLDLAEATDTKGNRTIDELINTDLGTPETGENYYYFANRMFNFATANGIKYLRLRRNDGSNGDYSFVIEPTLGAVFKLKAPEVAGFYKVKASFKDATADLYMGKYIPDSNNSNEAESYLDRSHNLIGRAVKLGDDFYKDETTLTDYSDTYKKVIYSDGTALTFGVEVPNNANIAEFRKLALEPVTTGTPDVATGETELTIGGITTASVSLDGATVLSSTITWESSKPEYATVNNGVITAAEEGTATITAKAGEDWSYSWEVTVTAHAPEGDAPAEGTVSFAQTTNVPGYNEISVSSVNRGDIVDLTAHKQNIEGYKFVGWKRGADESNENAWVDISGDTYQVWTNTYLTAIYEKTSDKAVEFWNQNGAYIGSMTEAVYNEQTTLFTPKLTGFGTFLGWFTDENVEFKAGETLAEGVTNAVAQYNASSVSGVTFNSNPINGADTYNAPVTLNKSSGATCWKRDGEIIAYGDSYKFNVWDATNITEGTEEITYKVPVAILDYSDIHKAYMLEYDAGDYEIVEAGIIFGKDTPDMKKYTSQRKVLHNQFTVPEEGSLEATGYIIYTLDGGLSYKVKYVTVFAAE